MNILWDFDGTLFDTYPIYTNSFKQILGNIPEKVIYQQLKISYTHAVNYFQLTEEQTKRIKEIENEVTPEDIRPFPDVEKVLQFANLNVIMTHNTRKEVENILTHYQWGHYFKEIVTIDNGFPRKPHPASYKYLHQKYDLDLIIGDRELDILAGKNLNIKTCLFQNNQAGADYYLSHYKDFFQLMQYIK
ncbi:HAD-IA family hydrolase [Heyndrickxia oleronia]|uniref:HAD-IA family hydrolase n=1 Tax=Heyndrickxia oleronia TaxID=38875 RepID=UPI0007174728|nr:HAD-IA family hydrolase [Heyndrickxia oleronia]MCM3455085.1 HAD-IA family hydrolase [Heyndrickxia oleronia]OJH18983.1 phosphoglycolate phosphatase [Bacillus obstructivus]